MIVVEWILFLFAWLFFAFGAFVFIACFIGLLKNNDFFIRMHAIKISNIYGISFILFANSLLSKDLIITVQILLVILVNILTTIVITHAVCRTAFIDGIKNTAISRRKYDELMEQEVMKELEQAGDI